jgi:TolB protein
MKLINYLFIVFLFTYVVDVNGQDKIAGKLTNIEMAYPFWTPDGEKIVFQSNWFGNWDIFIMDANGKNIQQLTFKESNQITPTISPDGMFIAYVSDETGNNQIYIMDINGKNNRRITDNQAQEIHPFWHPKEYKLLYNSTIATSESYEIFEIDLKENKTVQITFNDISETFASWSPDGSRLVYVKWNNEGGNIFTMDYDSKEELQITSHQEFDGWPVWYGSDEIIFASFRTDPAQIFKVNVVNKTMTQLTDNEEENARPNIWKNMLVYNGMKNGTMNIYLKKL